MEHKTEEERESHFWDTFAQGVVAITPVDPTQLDPLSAARLRLIGDVSGRNVLDLGCGIGFGAALLALRGAHVYAVDVSERCVEVTAERARVSGVADRVVARAMSAYALDFPDSFFDVVHGQDILHHLDVGPAGREVWRVLRPGGRAVFQENSANNRLLLVARRLCGHFGIPKWSTSDEYPLRRKEIAELSAIFGGHVECHYPVFEFLRLLDMKLFRYHSRLASAACQYLDGIVYDFLPWLRPYGYKQIVVLTRSRDVSPMSQRWMKTPLQVKERTSRV